MDAATLKAAGFSDQEIRLHQAGFSDAEIQAHTAPAQPTGAYKPSGWLDAITHGIGQLPNEAANLVGTSIATVPNFVNAVVHPQETAAALGDTYNKAAALLGGAVQHIRNLSPSDNQGSAPTMDTQPFDTAVSNAQQQYGTTQGLQSTIANHPLLPAVAAAAILHPTLNATGAYDAAGSALAPVVDAASQLPAVRSAVSAVAPIATRAGNIAASGGAVKAATGSMLDQGASVGAGNIAAVQAQADAQAAEAAQRSLLAQQAKARSDALAAQSTAAQAGAAAPTFQFGDTGPTYLSDIGNPVRDEGLAAQTGIESDMREADTKYRDAMNAVADEKASQGIGVSDTPEAKALIANSKSIVQPNPLTRPGVGNVPADSAGGKLHKMLLDVFDPPGQKLTLEEADTLKSQGIPVREEPNGTYSLPIKPSLQNVDDFRRLLGKIAGGNVRDYEGINTLEASQMRKDVASAMDSYANGTSAPVQANWAAGRQALAPFEEVGTGQAITGMQGSTGVPTVPAANLPGMIVGGGRDTVNQAAAVAGQAPVTTVLARQLHNAFLNADSYAGASKLVAPDTFLGDAIQGNDPLQAAVSDYLNRFKAADASGVQAKLLSQQSADAAQEASVHSKAADALMGKSSTTAAQIAGYQRQIADLQTANPKSIGSKYMDIITQAHKDGNITLDEYTKGSQLAATAEQAFKDRATRNLWITGALGAVGLHTPIGRGAASLILGH